MLAAVLPLLGAASRWIALSSDRTLPAQVRLAAPLNELIAQGAFEAVVAAIAVMPLYVVMRWFDSQVARPLDELEALLASLTPRAEELDRRRSELIGTFTGLKEKRDAVYRAMGALAARAVTSDNEKSQLEKDLEVLRAELPAIEEQLQSLETDADEQAKASAAIANDLTSLESRTDELRRRWPRPIQLFVGRPLRFRRSARARKVGIIAGLTAVVVFYLTFVPWWAAIGGLFMSVLAPGLVQRAVQSASFAQVLILVLVFASISAITSGLQPRFTSTVELRTRSGEMAGRYLLLGRTDTLTYIRPCGSVDTFVALAWSEVVSMKFDPAVRIPYVVQLPGSSAAKVLVDILGGRPIRIGQDTVECDPTVGGRAGVPPHF